jgi:hypothetical protein
VEEINEKVFKGTSRQEKLRTQHNTHNMCIYLLICQPAGAFSRQKWKEKKRKERIAMYERVSKEWENPCSTLEEKTKRKAIFPPEQRHHNNCTHSIAKKNSISSNKSFWQAVAATEINIIH